jgi:hypothetical protein
MNKIKKALVGTYAASGVLTLIFQIYVRMEATRVPSMRNEA